MNSTTHEDLLVLSGHFAYFLQRKKTIDEITDMQITVNGKRFEVLSNRNDRSGLDAFVVKNIETGEVSLIFAGSSDGMDWTTNIDNAMGSTTVHPV
ncbi:MAG: hypothetical protein ACRC6X_03460 [Culicoidibacterales bacterium]